MRPRKQRAAGVTRPACLKPILLLPHHSSPLQHPKTTVPFLSFPLLS